MKVGVKMEKEKCIAAVNANVMKIKIHKIILVNAKNNFYDNIILEQIKKWELTTLLVH
ncbi:hypothetical protein SMH99_26030 [Spiroplasma poulsonii]|uniref:hypothetical protein n=1 Tax=Spiroplasma poulsonii TaxID=2138 RepID=UPI000D669F89|nr:hypothetical protein [Spiroplasma poulsonii]PWF94184.1 hypothetical protein SMH99_26030 [Spiroplasma poulsonii]